jgi:CheY-like chemotaxis protein
LTETEEAPKPDTTDFNLRFGGRETILLVEDESEVRGLAARALRDFGYTVLCAADGVEAVELLGGHGGNVDLLVTDVVMPRMDGRELAQKVRLAYPGTKLLFVSGYDGLSAAGSAEALAGQTLLQKPFTAYRLAQRVRDVLDAP